jgi:hypothetical protein
VEPTQRRPQWREREQNYAFVKFDAVEPSDADPDEADEIVFHANTVITTRWVSRTNPSDTPTWSFRMADVSNDSFVQQKLRAFHAYVNVGEHDSDDDEEHSA